MSDIDKIIAAAERTAHTVDQLGAQFAQELATVLRQLDRKLRQLVIEASTGSTTALIKAAQANRTRLAIEKALADSGYEHLAEEAYGARLDIMTARVLAGRALAQEAAKLTVAFDQRIAALKLLHTTDMLDEGHELSRVLWKAVTRGVFGSQPAQKILDDLGEILDKTEPQIRALYDTSVSIFGRQVEALQAGNDPETVYLFAHVMDQKTRPFCLKYGGRVMTRKFIDTLDNGQLDNVYLTGGGYNCRGHFMEVSKFSELMDLVDTDKRVPEIQAQLSGLSNAA